MGIRPVEADWEDDFALVGGLVGLGELKTFFADGPDKAEVAGLLDQLAVEVITQKAER